MDGIAPLELYFRSPTLQVGTVSLLVESGVSVSEMFPSGSFPLTSLVCTRASKLICRQSVLSLLLSRGASVNSVDKDGRTPVMALLQSEAGVPSLDGLLYDLLQSGVDLSLAPNDMPTPLQFLCEQGRVSADMVTKLIQEYLAPVDCVDRRRNTPLLAACRRYAAPQLAYSSGGTSSDARALVLQTVRALLAQRANTLHVSLSGTSPMAVACQSAHSALLPALLEHGNLPPGSDLLQHPDQAEIHVCLFRTLAICGGSREAAKGLDRLISLVGASGRGELGESALEVFLGGLLYRELPGSERLLPDFGVQWNPETFTHCETLLQHGVPLLGEQIRVPLWVTAVGALGGASAWVRNSRHLSEINEMPPSARPPHVAAIMELLKRLVPGEWNELITEACGGRVGFHPSSADLAAHVNGCPALWSEECRRECETSGFLGPHTLALSLCVLHGCLPSPAGDEGGI